MPNAWMRVVFCFVLFCFNVYIAIRVLWSGFWNFPFRVKKRKSSRTIYQGHTPYLYLYFGHYVNMPAAQRFKEIIFFKILATILLDNNIRFFPPLLTLELWRKLTQDDYCSLLRSDFSLVRKCPALIIPYFTWKPCY